MAAVTAVGLWGSAAAHAETLAIADPTRDAISLVNSRLSYGDFDIDLTQVEIDHGTNALQITSKFNLLVSSSWTSLSIKLDTNQDGIADYTYVRARGGVEGVLNAADDVACALSDGIEMLGAGGRLVATIPRSCIGNPPSVSVHVDVVWIGRNTAGAPLSFVDSAPGQLIDDPVTFSRPIASSNTGTVTSPALPAPTPTAPTPPATGLQPSSPDERPTASKRRTTKVKFSATSKTQVRGKRAVTVTAKVSASGNPVGKLMITRNGKVVRNSQITAGLGSVRYTLPKSSKPGTYRFKATFTPRDGVSWKGATSTLRVKVK